LWREGAEVVRLTDTTVAGIELRERLTSLPRPLVAVIDDGQRLPEPLLASFVERAGSGIFVVAVVSDRSPIVGAGVHIDAEHAAAALAVSLARRRAETLAAVRALDSRVGDGFLNEPLERRLQLAADGAKTPWQLMFVLSAGWNRLANSVNQLDIVGGADLLLGAIASEQLLSLDNALTEAQLRQLATRCGRPPSWVDEGLVQLFESKLVLEMHGVRLPHQRFARSVFTLLLDRSRRTEFVTTMAALVASHTGSLIGLSWLLEDLRSASRDAGTNPAFLFDSGTRDRVAARAIEVRDGRERGAAANVLNELETFGRALSTDDVVTLGRWISAAQPEAMYGLARVVNDLSQSDPRAFELLMEQVDGRALMDAFARCSWSDAHAFGTLLDRMGSCSPAAFRGVLRRHLDRSAAIRLLGAWNDAEGAELYEIDRVVGGLSAIDLDTALEGLEIAADAIAERWQRKFADGWADLHNLQFVLGRAPAFLHPPPPSATQRRVGRRLVEALDAPSIASQLSGSVERQWESIGQAFELVAVASPRHARRIASLVDLDALDRATTGRWAKGVGVFRGLTFALARSPTGEPAATWFSRHLDEMDEIDDITFSLIPEAAALRARTLGCVVGLQGVETGSWEWVGDVLRRLIATDRDLAVRSVAARRTAFSAAFTAASYTEHEPLDKVLDLISNLDERLTRSLVADVDVGKAREVWARRLRGQAAERRAIARLVEIGLTCGGPVGELSRELRRRYPRASMQLRANQ
jgi:hypothetical protein